MRSDRRPVTRLVLALTAAVCTALAGAAGAGADPAESSTPSTPTPTETTQPSDPPPSSSETPPPSSETPPPTETEPPVTTQASLADLGVTAAFDKNSYATGETMSITVTIKNNGTGAIRTGVIIRTEPDAITVTSPN